MEKYKQIKDIHLFFFEWFFFNINWETFQEKTFSPNFDSHTLIYN